MSNICILFGEIPVSSQSDVMDLKKILARRVYLDTFEYQPAQRVLLLDAGFDTLSLINWLEKYVYKKIAELVPKDSYGKLYFKEGQFFSCIYFTHKRHKIVDYQEPCPPDWWGS